MGVGGARDGDPEGPSPRKTHVQLQMRPWANSFPAEPQLPDLSNGAGMAFLPGQHENDREGIH